MGEEKGEQGASVVKEFILKERKKRDAMRKLFPDIILEQKEAGQWYFTATPKEAQTYRTAVDAFLDKQELETTEDKLASSAAKSPGLLALLGKIAGVVGFIPSLYSLVIDSANYSYQYVRNLPEGVVIQRDLAAVMFFTALYMAASHRLRHQQQSEPGQG